MVDPGNEVWQSYLRLNNMSRWFKDNSQPRVRDCPVQDSHVVDCVSVTASISTQITIVGSEHQPFKKRIEGLSYAN